MASVMIHDLIPIRRRGKYQSYIHMSQTVSIFYRCMKNNMHNKKLF